MGTTVVAVVSAVRLVGASESYPAIVQSAVEASCQPGCDLCHVDKTGGPGRPNGSVFLAAMRNTGGLQPAQPQTVVPAIETLRMLAEMDQTQVDVDTDDDGIDDITELEQETNPVTGERFCGPGPIEYGCFNRVAPEGPDGTGTVAGLGVLLGLAALGRRRRRARRLRL